MYPSLFWLTPEEERTQRQVLCIAVHLYTYICDTLPLDNPKIHSHTALPYITWGLVWYLKIKREVQDIKIKKEIPIEIKIFSEILKLRRIPP